MPADATEAAAIESHFVACRLRIAPFAKGNFSLHAAVHWHRFCFFPDILLAPLNLFLVGPRLFLNLTGFCLRKLGAVRIGKPLQELELAIPTALRRHLRRRLLEDLLQIEAIAPLVPESERRAWRRRLDRLIDDYLGARDAIAEFAAGLTALTFGFLILRQLTPGAISLGPLLASDLAHREAVRNFWLGPWAGEVWYELVGVDTPIAWVVLAILAMLGLLALIASVIGVVTDPVQTWTGVHRRRLQRLVDASERVTRDAADTRLALKDPYLPRIADLLDLTVSALRFGR